MALLKVMVYFGLIAHAHYLTLTVTEMVTMKVIYIFKFSKIASMNEYVISNTLISFNIIIIFVITVLRITTGEYESSPFFGYVNQQNQRTELHRNVLK